MPHPERDDPARIDRAIALYRERYVPTGAFENAVYDGIHEALAELRAEGHRLVLCTSKPWVMAERICEHFDLTRHLDEVYGAELEGVHGDKTSLLAWVLEGVQAGPEALAAAAVPARPMVPAAAETDSADSGTRSLVSRRKVEP